MNHRVEQLFHEAMDLAPAERLVFLRKACAGDESLLAEVQTLLNYGSEASAVFDGAIERLAATFTPVEGSRAGAYRLLKPIGEGGMGVVYLGVRDDGQFDHQVAIKFVQGGEEVMARFRQERQILARLAHPNIARLIDGGITEDGHPFMVMDYFPGKPITEYSESLSLPLTERLRLFRSACDAIEHAHRSLIIHRDVKPSNILVNEHGELKLLDFGIAKLLEPGADSVALTMTGMRFFTPDYASPEQVRGDAATTATDVYSLGAVLYELLTGRRPHGLSKYTPAEITQAVCLDPVAPPQLGADLDAIVLMALRKEPERRYASVAHLSEDIGRFLDNRPILARPDATGYRIRKFIQRHRFPVAAAAFAIVSLVAGAATAVWQARIARMEAAEARHRFEQVRKLARTVLFDLDPKIRNLTGSTDARELLVQTALQYLDSLHASARTDPALRRELAVAYERVGDVQGEPGHPNLGQRQNAIESYRKAAELWQQTPAISTKDSLAQARINLKLSEIGSRAGSLQKGAELATAAVSASPNEETYAIAVRAYRLLGVNSNNHSDIPDAMLHLNKALEFAARWQKESSTELPLEAQASVYTTIADAQLRKGDPQATLEAISHVVRIRQNLLKAHPESAIHKRALFRAHMYRAAALGDPDNINLGQTAKSVEAFRQAMEIAKEQQTADPRSALARGDLADVEAALGNTLAKSDPKQAQTLLASSLAHYDVLLKAAPQNLSFKSNAAQIHAMQAAPLHALGLHGAAVEHLHRALALHREIAAARPAQAGLRFNLMGAMESLASLHLDLGQKAEAAAVLREALEIAGTVPRDASYPARIPYMARVHAALGRLHVMNRTGQARTWYQKSLALWDELEKSGVPASQIRPRRVAVERAMASAQ